MARLYRFTPAVRLRIVFEPVHLMLLLFVGARTALSDTAHARACSLPQDITWRLLRI